MALSKDLTTVIQPIFQDESGLAVKFFIQKDIPQEIQAELCETITVSASAPGWIIRLTRSSVSWRACRRQGTTTRLRSNPAWYSGRGTPSPLLDQSRSPRTSLRTLHLRRGLQDCGNAVETDLCRERDTHQDAHSSQHRKCECPCSTQPTYYGELNDRNYIFWLIGLLGDPSTPEETPLLPLSLLV